MSVRHNATPCWERKTRVLRMLWPRMRQFCLLLGSRIQVCWWLQGRIVRSLWGERLPFCWLCPLQEMCRKWKEISHSADLLCVTLWLADALWLLVVLGLARPRREHCNRAWTAFLGTSWTISAAPHIFTTLAPNLLLAIANIILAIGNIISPRPVQCQRGKLRIGTFPQGLCHVRSELVFGPSFSPMHARIWAWSKLGSDGCLLLFASSGGVCIGSWILQMGQSVLWTEICHRRHFDWISSGHTVHLGKPLLVRDQECSRLGFRKGILLEPKTFHFLFRSNEGWSQVLAFRGSCYQWRCDAWRPMLSGNVHQSSNQRSSKSFSFSRPCDAVWIKRWQCDFAFHHSPSSSREDSFEEGRLAKSCGVSKPSPMALCFGICGLHCRFRGRQHCGGKGSKWGWLKGISERQMCFSCLSLCVLPWLLTFVFLVKWFQFNLYCFDFPWQANLIGQGITRIKYWDAHNSHLVYVTEPDRKELFLLPNQGTTSI